MSDLDGEEEIETRLSDSTRVEAFSDAVMAIALTLLVLDLRPPESEPGRLLDGLLDQWPGYVAYLASFGYLAVIWLNHHAVFTRIKQVDRGLKLANLGLLLTATVLPFPTAVLSNALQLEDLPDKQAAIGLYALVAMLMCASWLGFWHYLRHHEHLLEAHVDAEFFREEQIRGWVGIALYAIGGALGIVVAPVIALIVFVLLPPFYGVTSDGLRESPLYRGQRRRPPPRHRRRRRRRRQPRRGKIA
jgi:uncharacterized membrane protein